ncbi:hypothetical protein MN116_003712 [Schistosoma mekongi]|uniref:Uncharacterized protein n=1 Tax=Schistosoma mekongi TaxID=38744 RepID=A0AAE1ZFQ2_SCHME|nr:hypothetical protein MN116_003712 [Schistosoma mekongi]
MTNGEDPIKVPMKAIIENCWKLRARNASPRYNCLLICSSYYELVFRLERVVKTTQFKKKTEAKSTETIVFKQRRKCITTELPEKQTSILL